MEAITFEDIKQLFKETDLKFKEMMVENEKRWKEIQQELGGIGKSNGEIAEDFFYTALSQSMKVANFSFDYIDRNIRRKRNNIEAEFDIILYNNYKVLIVEVKYNFRMNYLQQFYKEKLKVFTKLYPEYQNYKIYGAIAALTFEKNVIKEAENFGFYILTQNNDKIRIINNNEFYPNEIK